MAEYAEYLAILDSDPTNDQALSALERIMPLLWTREAGSALDQARESLRERGQLELVERLFDVEIKSTPDSARVVDLLRRKGQLYAEDFLDEKNAVACYRRVLELEPNDADTQEALEHLDLLRENWKKVVQKYVSEAKGSTDRHLTTSLYLSAAETTARYAPDAPEVEDYLRRALDVDPANRRASAHLERLLRASGKWDDLAALLERRADGASAAEERIDALVALAELARTHLGRSDLAVERMKRVVALDPAHPRALSLLSDEYSRESNWSALVMLYTNALKARRRGASAEVEVGTLLQIAMLHWKRLGNLDAAEEYFRRVRKVDPAHQAALEFYGEYLRAKGDANQLLQIVRQAHKAVPDSDAARKRQLSISIAEISEFDLANPEKAIEAWKGILRAEPDAPEPRAALRRLYAKAEKWNALLDLIKEEIERRPQSDVEGRIAGLLQVVAIYRDHIKVAGDVMAINTYNAILTLDPHHREAIDALAERYKHSGRWNDLISVLGRKADLPGLSMEQRVDILREMAQLWIERFGNYAQAVGPLEQLLDLAPGDREAMASLKDIYNRRRQWRALISLYGREAAQLAIPERRRHLVDMAQLAAERLGDSRLAIEIWNRVLELGGEGGEAEVAAALSALATLYEKDKRYLALADVYRRQHDLARTPQESIAVLERLGGLFAERLRAPAQAAEAYHQILRADPHHPRAARTLRELYSHSGDYAALEQVYSQLGQWDELVEAFQATADRVEDRPTKLDLLVRAANVAAEHSANQERVARAWERVLSVDPRHLAAARALVPIYAKGGKPARLLGAYEILLEHADDDDRRLQLLQEIRALCEERLGSKALAFQWAARAYKIRPAEPRLLAELERLGAEADAWDEVAAILDERVRGLDVEPAERLRVLRELGKISHTRLHQPDRAHGYWEQVLEIIPEDREAIAALEEIATQQADWPDLLKIFRRRADLEGDSQKRIDLLFRIAFLEEERLADADAAVLTYRKVVEIDPSSRRALKALAKLDEARGDWAGLAEVLERELELLGAAAQDSDGVVALLLRLGGLYENNLSAPDRALAAYRRALSLQPSVQIHRQLERFLLPEASADARREVAALLLPAYETADDAERIVRALEILRESAPADAPAEGTPPAQTTVDIDRRLVHLYGQRLARPDLAYQASLRVLEREPERAEMRAEALRLADATGVIPDYADHLELLLDEVDQQGAPPAVRHALATDLAELCLDRLVDLERAERAWRVVLGLEPVDTAALSGLERIYRTTGRWADLRSLCEEQLEHTLDNTRRIDLLFAIADLSETLLGDAEGAAAAYARALEVDPSLMRAYRSLERILEATGRWIDLEDLLAREQTHVGERMAEVPLLVRRARLRAEKLSNRRGAIDLVDEVLARHRGNADARELLEELLSDPDERLRVARTLEPLYLEDGLWRDLCLVLRAQREFATSDDEAAELLARVAATEEERLAHERGAFDTWRQVLALRPGDERARREILRLAGGLSLWSEALEALEGALAATDADDVAGRIAILREIAHVTHLELRDPEAAQAAYRRLLDADPGNIDNARFAAQALDRLYVEGGRWPELIGIVRRQAEWADPGPERVALLTRLAVLEEERSTSPDAAVAAWRDVLVEEPDDRDALDALERLHQKRGETRELADIIRRRIELAGRRATDAAEKKRQLVRLAFLFERDLHSVQDATGAWLEILDFAPEDVEALDQLGRLFRAGDRHSDLLDILERRLAGTQEPRDRLAITFEVGELLHLHLQRDAEALDQYVAVLEADPTHGDALVRLEGMLQNPELRLRAADALLPLYERGGQWQKLTDLLVLVADHVGDPRSRLRHLRRVAELRELHLRDRPGAFAAMREAVVAAVAEPDLRELLRELERLAAEEGRLGDLIEVYQQIAPDVFDGELQRRLYLDIADLARGVRKDDSLARRHYQMVLEAQPDDRRALDALEGIHRDAGDSDALYEILVRKADLAGDDLELRALALADAARLSQKMGRSVDALVVWEQVIELTPDNRDAHEALEQLYQETERWHDLTDLIERRLGFAFTVDEAVRLRFRLGQICETQLHDPERAVENYAAALGGEPGHLGATAALERFLDDPGTRAQAAEVLEPIYVGRQDWPRLVRIYDIKLESAHDPAERLALSRYIARLHEDQLEDLDGAFRWYGRVFRENPGEPGLRSQLVRLAGVLDGWASLANIYQEYLDDTPGDSPEVREVALALAELCDRRLNEIERAQSAYRRVLSAAPDDVETFARLEVMLARGQRWYALVEAYNDAIQATLDDRRRLDLHRRTAGIYEEKLSDIARAIDAHRAALDIDPDDPISLADLDRLYQTQKQWSELGELMSARIDRAEAPEEQVEMRVRLADLLENRMNDPDGAIDQYEKVLSEHRDQRSLAALERLVVLERHKERIAGILEPIYRANDWWRKLVVILAAQLEYKDDPRDKVTTLREIAELHEKRGGDLGLALNALSRAWLEDTGDDEVYHSLLALSTQLDAWDQLVATLDQGIANEYDTERVVSILHRIAGIHEVHREDRPSAIATLRRLLEQREEDAEALAALDRLLEAEGRHAELVEVVSRRADLAVDLGIRHVLLERVAMLYEQALARPREAIAGWRAVLTVDESDRRALDALERLYRIENEPRELAGILARKIELAEAPGSARLLRFAAAQVYELELREPFEAITQMRAVLDGDADDREALAALDRLYTTEEMWPDLLEVLDRRAELEADPAARADLRHRAALVVAERLLEPDQAVERLRVLLDDRRDHVGARDTLDAMTRDEDTLAAAADVLEAIYRVDAAHDKLAELYERRLASPLYDRDDRAGQLAALATLHEVSRGDVHGAFGVWARALREAPEDTDVQGHLERLAEARGAWRELVELYGAMLEGAVSPELEFAYASKVARVQEEALGDLDEAAEQYRRALAAASDERDTLDALARIYERSARWSDLADILARQADAWMDEAKQAEVLFRLGDVREERLSDPPGAVIAYREVLERDPAHAAARAALERLIRDERVRADVVSILEPIYEADRDDVRLTDLLAAKLTVTRAGPDRAAIFARVAELAEDRLNDPVRALDAAGGWLAEDPSSEEALSELERLAEQTGRWGEVAARLRGIVATADSPSQRLALFTKLGTIQLDRERDLGAAEQAFRAVLEIEPDSALALGSLEQVYRQSRDDTQLADILWRRADQAFDASEQRALRAEVADLRERMNDAAGAIEAWGAVLAIDEGDREALQRAAAIYERHAEWPQLIETLEVSARYAGGAEEERAIRTRIAQLWTDQVGDLDQAAPAWQAVLDLEPGAPDALDALEQVHGRRGDWAAVQDALTARLDHVDGDADRIPIYQRLAHVAEVERKSIDEAAAYLHQILDIDGTHGSTLDHLEQLLTGSARWHELVELYERQAEAHGAQGRVQEEVRALAKAAEVWEGPLENRDAAGEVLEKILARQPDFVPALTRLARIHDANEDWERSADALRRALALGPRGSDAADLHVRMGEAARRQAEADGRDADGAALEHYLEALRHEPKHREAIAAAEGVARRREDWVMLADLMARRLSTLTGADEKLALALELAAVYGERLGQPARAVPLLEEAVRLKPGDARALAPLADVYLAAGRHAEAAPLFERLADEAKKARQMKDVARYRQRLGQLYHLNRQPDQALASYEEAFRIDPTNVPTMVGLGNLYVDRKEWEKAKRVYRSLVLQRIDPASGITMGEAYYRLGLIHIETNEKDKAKGMFQRALDIEPQNPTFKAALTHL